MCSYLTDDVKISPIWTWFKGAERYFGKIKNATNRGINKRSWVVTLILIFVLNCILGDVPISVKTSYHKILISFESCIQNIWSLWNLTGASAAVLQRHLWNFQSNKMIWITTNSQLSDFTRSNDKKSYRIWTIFSTVYLCVILASKANAQNCDPIFSWDVYVYKMCTYFIYNLFIFHISFICYRCCRNLFMILILVSLISTVFVAIKSRPLFYMSSVNTVLNFIYNKLKIWWWKLC